VVLVVAAVVAVVVSNPAVRAEFLVAWNLLWDGSPEPIREWLLGFGAWAPVISTLLQVATSVFPPGPSFLLGIANAMVFGPLWGGLLTLASALLAAAVCFGIARVVGRPGVERIVSEEKLRRMDRFMERRGMLAVFIGRLIPFINPDLVSYAAGVTGIGWVPFLAAMTAGTIPSVVFYTTVGAAAIESAGWVVVVVGFASVVPLVVLFAFRRRLYRRQAERRSGEGDSDGATGLG
jgi:uncharacterized membrane protein YdjX (TVP38/TMEM64 family)